MNARYIGLAILIVISLAVLVSQTNSPEKVDVDQARDDGAGTESLNASASSDPANDELAQSDVDLAEMRSNLDRLVSPDLEVKRLALVELTDEFRAVPLIADGKFSTYGDELLTVLHSIVDDLEDPYSHYAIEAVYLMTLIDAFRDPNRRNLLTDAQRQQLSELDHYPYPTAYQPLSDAFLKTLVNSENENARKAAAMALANGFEPARDIEAVFVDQLQHEEESGSVQSAILTGISAIGDRVGLSSDAEQAVRVSLASPNIKTQEIATRLVMLHEIDQGLDSLVAALPLARDDVNAATMLSAIVTLGSSDDALIVEIERIAAETLDESRKQQILEARDMLRDKGDGV